MQCWSYFSSQVQAVHHNRNMMTKYINASDTVVLETLLFFFLSFFYHLSLALAFMSLLYWEPSLFIEELGGSFRVWMNHFVPQFLYCRSHSGPEQTSAAVTPILQTQLRLPPELKLRPSPPHRSASTTLPSQHFAPPPFPPASTTTFQSSGEVTSSGGSRENQMMKWNLRWRSFF